MLCCFFNFFMALVLIGASVLVGVGAADMANADAKAEENATEANTESSLLSSAADLPDILGVALPDGPEHEQTSTERPDRDLKKSLQTQRTAFIITNDCIVIRLRQQTRAIIVFIVLHDGGRCDFGLGA
jgi:hypothetical protein